VYPVAGAYDVSAKKSAIPVGPEEPVEGAVRHQAGMKFFIKFFIRHALMNLNSRFLTKTHDILTHIILYKFVMSSGFNPRTTIENTMSM